MYDILLTLHFAGLFMGGAPALSLLVVGAVTASAPVEHRASLGRVVKPVKMIGHSGIALLLVTGVLMATTTGAWGTAPIWFWIKILGVAALIFGIVKAAQAGARAMAGEPEAGALARKIGLLNLGTVALILLMAVLAFN